MVLLSPYSARFRDRRCRTSRPCRARCKKTWRSSDLPATHIAPFYPARAMDDDTEPISSRRTMENRATRDERLSRQNQSTTAPCHEKLELPSPISRENRMILEIKYPLQLSKRHDPVFLQNPEPKYFLHILLGIFSSEDRHILGTRLPISSSLHDIFSHPSSIRIELVYPIVRQLH